MLLKKYSIINSKEEKIMKKRFCLLSMLMMLISAVTVQAEGYPDFTQAVESASGSVVHVMTKAEAKQTDLFGGWGFDDPFFQYFFGQPRGQQKRQQSRPVMASGSGVIISADGYIATNNHVVESAEEIEVVLNDKRSFPARIIGRDPNTDLALLKIDVEGLPAIKMGSSDELKVGEWVLAIGNPFNLTSTVTAGIVSSKARNINILSGDMKIESFIQTDAAVNPGNSGGALVNTKGELVGINTAIATQTGSYAGYSFAIPTTIVRKVIDDLRQYGTVQRAVLGVTISDISDTLAKEKKIDVLEGAYVHSVVPDGAAAAAGVKEGDVITGIDGRAVGSVSELQEQIATHAPGDKVRISVLRGKKPLTLDIELKNLQGNVDVVTPGTIESLGASLEELSEKQARELKVSGGVRVAKVKKGGRFEKAGIREGFVIRRINNSPIQRMEDVKREVERLSSTSSENALFISGTYPDGRQAYYAVDMNAQ